MAEIVLVIGLLVFLAHFFTALFRRTRVPDVLLLLLLGVILGPVTGWVKPEDFGHVGGVISMFALIVILFESGIDLKPDVIARTWRPTLGLTLTTFVITLGCAYLCAYYLLGLSPMLSWILGATVGGTSAAVVIALVKSLKMPDPGGTVLILESALGDVLCIVLLLGLVEAAALGSLHAVKMIGSIFSSLVCAGIIGMLGGFLWLAVLNSVRQFPNTTFTTLAFLFILFGISDMLGFSGAIAALAFGATLTNHQRLDFVSKQEFLRGRVLGSINESDVDFFMEILFLLKTFFFIYMGVSIRFTDIRLIGVAAVFTIAVFLLRVPIVRFVFPRGAVAWQDATLMTFMVPKGLVSAVLASIPVERGLPGAEIIRDFTYMVVLLSVVLTAVLIPISEAGPVARFYRRIFAGPSLPEPSEPEPEPAAE
ncbi:MAG TPA: cation:proton antiporter [Bryobacteraceae bacterium]|nr:cation:proton antiporter [Bryobacteraceae bacterium]